MGTRYFRSCRYVPIWTCIAQDMPFYVLRTIWCNVIFRKRHTPSSCLPLIEITTLSQWNIEAAHDSVMLPDIVVIHDDRNDIRTSWAVVNSIAAVAHNYLKKLERPSCIWAVGYSILTHIKQERLATVGIIVTELFQIQTKISHYNETIRCYVKLLSGADQCVKMSHRSNLRCIIGIVRTLPSATQG